MIMVKMCVHWRCDRFRFIGEREWFKQQTSEIFKRRKTLQDAKHPMCETIGTSVPVAT